MVNMWVLLHLALAQALGKQDRQMDTLGVNRLHSVFGYSSCEMQMLVSDMLKLATLLHDLVAVWLWELTKLQSCHLQKELVRVALS